MSSSDERIRKRKGYRSPMLILGLTMTVIYFILGIVFLLKPDALPNVPANFRIGFSVMLLVYGAYRSWRLYADVKS